MATPKEIKKRINAVKNTKKITKTMEMVATAKSKKCLNRVNNALLYSKQINLLFESFSLMNVDYTHPLLRKKSISKRIAILVVGTNRGLCGGFNNNILKKVFSEIEIAKKNNFEIDFYLIGKKTVSTFNFLKVPFVSSYTNIEDKPTFLDAKNIANTLISIFNDKKVDSVKIISTRYLTASEQIATVDEILPIDIAQKSLKNNNIKNLNLEPNAISVLNLLLPRFLRGLIFQILLESALSEQIYRRIAMKNASENASEIVRNMSRMYNRVRQAKITQEIAEIVGGVSAFES